MLISNVSKTWAMPSGKTFKIAPIRDIILKYVDYIIASTENVEKNWVRIIDPFANEASIKQYLTKYVHYVSNDLDPQYNTDYHENALDFLKRFPDNSADMLFYDPPYSFRQVSECYKKLNLTVTAKDTSNKFFADFKKEIARIIRPNGYVISCGWNSNGIGQKLGFEQDEILLVAHGSNHNDTIVVVERKSKIC